MGASSNYTRNYRVNVLPDATAGNDLEFIDDLYNYLGDPLQLNKVEQSYNDTAWKCVDAGFSGGVCAFNSLCQGLLSGGATGYSNLGGRLVYVGLPPWGNSTDLIVGTDLVTTARNPIWSPGEQLSTAVGWVNPTSAALSWLALSVPLINYAFLIGPTYRVINDTVQSAHNQEFDTMTIALTMFQNTAAAYAPTLPRGATYTGFKGYLLYQLGPALPAAPSPPHKRKGPTIGAWVHTHRMGSTTLFRTTQAVINHAATSADVTVNVQDKTGSDYGNDLYVAPGGTQATGAYPRGVISILGEMLCVWASDKVTAGPCSLSLSTDFGRTWEASVSLFDNALYPTIDIIKDGSLLAAAFVPDASASAPSSEPEPCPSAPTVALKFGHIFLRRKAKGETAWSAGAAILDEMGTPWVFQQNSFHFEQGHEEGREYRLFAAVAGYCSPQVLYSGDHGLTWTIDTAAFPS